MGPKSKKDKRIEALSRMMAKGPAPVGTSTPEEYDRYLERRKAEIVAIQRKIGEF